MAKTVRKITEPEQSAAEKQIKAKQQEIKYDQRDFTIKHIVNDYREGLFYIPEYQRNAIWPVKDQCRFVESVILGLPIPFMFVAEVDDGRLEIVDGVQRISTLESFMNDDLNLTGLVRLPLLNGMKYSDLPTARQLKIGTRALRIIVLEDSTTAETRQEIFDRINTSGKPANAQEVRRGAKPGPFMSFITECGSDSRFRKLCPMSEMIAMRREGEELVLRFFAYSDRYQEFKHNVDEFLDQFAADHQKKFDKQRMHSEFHRMLEFVERHFANGFAKAPNSKATPRVRFEAISVGVNLALRKKPELAENIPPAWQFNDDEEFKKQTTTHASNSGPRLAARVEFVRNRLLESLR
ncbi:MAG: DUF262 domain-containing protein [Rhodopirellula sp.]|nr:DUF262 domain-containing protein [Rhodopirellula sp.]